MGVSKLEAPFLSPHKIDIIWSRLLLEKHAHMYRGSRNCIETIYIEIIITIAENQMENHRHL